MRQDYWQVALMPENRGHGRTMGTNTMAHTCTIRMETKYMSFTEETRDEL
jgi:hypothetical protein